MGGAAMSDPCDKEVMRYLLRYHDAADNIESLTAEKERIEGTIYSLTANLSDSGGGGGSSSGDKIGDGVARLCDIVDQINAEIIMYQKSREEVRRVVNRVKDVNITLGQCLHYRYIDSKSAFAVANDMGFSTRQERRVHRQALEVASRYM